MNEKVYRSRLIGDVRQLYSHFRNHATITQHIQSWNQEYLHAARHYHVSINGNLLTELPKVLEQKTLIEATQTGPYHGFVLIGGSDVGKSSIRKKLTEDGLLYIPQMTTRVPRENIEIPGIDYQYVTDDVLRHADVFPIIDRVHAGGEPAYRSALPKQPLLDALKNRQHFVLDLNIEGWQKIETELRQRPDISEEMINGILIVFILPPAPHVVALRAIDRTFKQLNHAYGDVINEKTLDKVYAEMQRSLEKHKLLSEVREKLDKVHYVVNDDILRVTQQLHTLHAA